MSGAHLYAALLGFEESGRKVVPVDARIHSLPQSREVISLGPMRPRTHRRQCRLLNDIEIELFAEEFEERAVYRCRATSTVPHSAHHSVSLTRANGFRDQSVRPRPRKKREPNACKINFRKHRIDAIKIMHWSGFGLESDLEAREHVGNGLVQFVVARSPGDCQGFPREPPLPASRERQVMRMWFRLGARSVRGKAKCPIRG